MQGKTFQERESPNRRTTGFPCTFNWPVLTFFCLNYLGFSLLRWHPLARYVMHSSMEECVTWYRRLTSWPWASWGFQNNKMKANETTCITQNVVILNFYYWSFCVIYMELILAFSCSLLSRSSAIVSLIPLPLGRFTWALFVLPMMKMLLIRVANWWPVLSLTWTMSNEPEIQQTMKFQCSTKSSLGATYNTITAYFCPCCYNTYPFSKIKTTSFNREEEKKSCTVDITNFEKQRKKNWKTSCTPNFQRVHGLLNKREQDDKIFEFFLITVITPNMEPTAVKRSGIKLGFGGCQSNKTH